MQALFLGTPFRFLRAGHDQHTHAGRHASAAQDRRRLSQVGDTGVGTGTHEYDLDGVALDRLSRIQSHVVKRPGTRPAFRHLAHHRCDHPGVGAPGDLRLQVGNVHSDFGVEPGARITGEIAPLGHRAVPVFAFRTQRPTMEVLEGDVVGSHHARARARLDGHVAQGHAFVHGHRAHRLAAELDHLPGTAPDADPADQRQDHVLGGDALLQAPAELYGQRPGSTLQQTLGSEDVGDLGRADTEGQRTERAVSSRMAVATDDRHARPGRALLRSDHVHDAATGAVHAEQPDSGTPAVHVQLAHLVARLDVHVREPGRGPVRQLSLEVGME